MLIIEAEDLCQNTERRVVNDDRVACVLLVLIVAARIKRAHEVVAFYVVLFDDPASDRVIYNIGRVTVIGRFLGLELLEEVVVFVVAFFSAGVVSFAVLEPVDLLRNIEASQLDNKVGFCQLFKFDRDHFLVPSRKLCQPIVCEYVCTPLRVCKPFDVHARDRLHPDRLRCF